MKGTSGASERQIVEYCLAVGNTVMLKQENGYQIVFIQNEKHLLGLIINNKAVVDQTVLIAHLFQGDT